MFFFNIENVEVARTQVFMMFVVIELLSQSTFRRSPL